MANSKNKLHCDFLSPMGQAIGTNGTLGRKHGFDKTNTGDRKPHPGRNACDSASVFQPRQGLHNKAWGRREHGAPQEKNRKMRLNPNGVPQTD